jgi:hypothetical protein
MNVRMAEPSVDSRCIADKRVVNALTHLRIRLEFPDMISHGDNDGLFDRVSGAALLLARELMEVELTLGSSFDPMKR